jgi:rod shape determining protein RodA
MQGKRGFGIIIAITILSLIGLIMIFSTADVQTFTKQAIWLVIGMFAAITLSRIPPRFWSNIAPVIYAAVIILLLLLLFTSGSYPKRWFRIGTIAIQPSEFAKFATVIFLASYLAGRKRLKRFSDLMVPLIIVTLPAFLIFLEPDLGSAQIFFPILLLMLFWAGMPAPKIFIYFSPLVSAVASFVIYVWVAYFIGLIIFLYYQKQMGDFIYGVVGNFLAGLIMPFVWNLLKPYQQERIVSFFSPWVDPRGMAWQTIQSKIAIGSGGIIGKGFLSGTQKKLEFLPLRHTDFVFSCLGEEFGLIGIFLTTVVFALLFYRLLFLARSTKNRFASIFIAGVLAWIGYQTFVNMGITLGLLPITGVPLPFISYGGSSLIACYMAIGICIAISRSKFQY